MPKKVIKYTIIEKIEHLIVLKKKINELGLGVYNTEMNLLSKIMNNYIKDNEEFYGGIPLPGSKRIIDIIFKNNKKHKISIILRYSPST
jgi:hypothetical protein|tara:strand:- start:3485 stop:3751 length:267 start_codon:yes stop_codon:yes gene_type:complete